MASLFRVVLIQAGHTRLEIVATAAVSSRLTFLADESVGGLDGEVVSSTRGPQQKGEGSYGHKVEGRSQGFDGLFTVPGGNTSDDDHEQGQQQEPSSRCNAVSSVESALLGQSLQSESGAEGPAEPAKGQDAEDEQEDARHRLVEVEGGGWVASSLVPNEEDHVRDEQNGDGDQDRVSIGQVVASDGPALRDEDQHEDEHQFSTHVEQLTESVHAWHTQTVVLVHGVVDHHAEIAQQFEGNSGGQDAQDLYSALN